MTERTCPTRFLPRAKKPGVLCYSGQFYWWKGMSTLMESMRWVEDGILRLYGGGYSTAQRMIWN